MTIYYQRPLNRKELAIHDNKPEVSSAERFNIKSPMYDSELYDKINLRRMTKQFNHTDKLKHLNLVINNAITTKRPLFN